MVRCKDCNDTGKVLLLNFTVDCYCVSNPPSPCSEDLGPQDFPVESDMKNGWYSAKYAAAHGCVVYMHATTGKEVTITEISSKSTPFRRESDLKFVGIINKNKKVRGGIR